MKSKLRLIGRAGALLAFLFCVLGGGLLVGLCLSERKGSDNSYLLWVCFGLYFIGKGFFVGPMLWLATEQVCGRREPE
jgi:hypothetical protein